MSTASSRTEKGASRTEGFAVGIDLGTTYSCVGVFQNNNVEIIANEQGNRTTPSYVAFTDTERLVGDGAKNQVSMNPLNTVFDAKRLIGRQFGDAAVQADMKHLPFSVVEGRAGQPVIRVGYKGEDKTLRPEEAPPPSHAPPDPPQARRRHRRGGTGRTRRWSACARRGCTSGQGAEA